MVSFVDRETELVLIDETLRALQNYQEVPLRTPIIDFYGVEGIGKTTLLETVEQKCQKLFIRCIRIKIGTSFQQFLQTLYQEFTEIYPVSILQDTPLLQMVVSGINQLLEQGAIVLLIDAVDTGNEDFVQQLEVLLREVIDHTNLLVIITSRQSLLFERERAVARKTTNIHLLPFDQKNSNFYIDGYVETTGKMLEAEIRAAIFEWTRGYPLALKVVTQAVIEHDLDPRRPEHQQALVTRLVEQVILHGVFSSIRSEDVERHLIALSLFSVPRRFNLVIMQDLIEEFEPQLKQESSLAYMSMPRHINQMTGILNWNMFKVGYAVDGPVRNIFLLKLRIEQPERYQEIHRFLATLNQKFASTVSGIDRMRYVREYFYHRTCIEAGPDITAFIQQTMQEIFGGTSYDSFGQFIEEFRQDEELLEALGDRANIVFAFLYQRLATVHWEAMSKATNQNYGLHIQDFFFYIINAATHDPLQPELSEVLSQYIQALLTNASVEQRSELETLLLKDERFREELGKHFILFATLWRTVAQEKNEDKEGY